MWRAICQRPRYPPLGIRLRWYDDEAGIATQALNSAAGFGLRWGHPLRSNRLRNFIRSLWVPGKIGQQFIRTQSVGELISVGDHHQFIDLGLLQEVLQLFPYRLWVADDSSLEFRGNGRFLKCIPV